MAGETVPEAVGGWVPPEAQAQAPAAAAPAWTPPEVAATAEDAPPGGWNTDLGKAEREYPVEAVASLASGRGTIGIGKALAGMVLRGFIKPTDGVAAKQLQGGMTERFATESEMTQVQAAEAVRKAAGAPRAPGKPAGEVLPPAGPSAQAAPEPAPATSAAPRPSAEDAFTPRAALRRGRGELIEKPASQLKAQEKAAGTEPMGSAKRASVEKDLRGVLAGKIVQAMHMQESGGATKHLPPNYAGAVGPMQILPATFKRFARKGESIDDPQDNLAVGKRIIAHYLEVFGDPGRAMVAYYSGPGNVASANKGVPWKRDLKPKGPGPSVSEYVSEVVSKIA